METKVHADMAQAEMREERSKDPEEEMAEKQFLKNLYMFMKKRETPIERIPNLGFRQIDLYLMYKAVRDLGGYHQVTAQQLWKQVYNMLGGNPRSTSAATCTRRHYEKLLLPYECHERGILMNLLTVQQPKLFHCSSYNKEDGHRATKRKLISVPLHQIPPSLQPDPRATVLHPSLHYTHYYHPSHTVLPPPHIPISSRVLTPHSPSPSSQPWITLHPRPSPSPSPSPSHVNPSDRVKEPLEQLRSLAEHYKTSSGLAEPLNLSLKASRQETHNNPVSSFAPPSANKTPKFLNKPSTLYPPRRQQGVRNEDSDTQDDEETSERFPHPGKTLDENIIDVDAMTPSSSPRYGSPEKPDEDGLTLGPSSPKRPREDGRYQDERGISLGSFVPRENGGKMEIKVPLSVFHNWLRMCKSSDVMQESDALPTNITFHVDPRHQSSTPEDLRQRRRSPSSPTATLQTPGNHLSPFTGYKHLPPGGIPKNCSDVHPFDQHHVNESYRSKPPNYWDVYDKKTRVPLRTDSSPLPVQQAGEDTHPGRKDRPETVSPGFVMVNSSSSSSLLQLTTEEVMKLKRIISSSV